MRRSDVDLLAPAFRARLESLLADVVDGAKLPFRVFETIRSPGRQNELFAQGRDPTKSDFGRTITRARSYDSLHQWGHAADIVGFIDGRWTWDLPRGWWDVLGHLALKNGLETLSFERPHVQTPGFVKDRTHGPLDEVGWTKWLADAVLPP